jgi:hypothetical protein
MNPFHYYLATDGLGPGTTHYTISVLGRRVSITITPIPPAVGGGGGGSPGTWLPTERFLVTVKVEFKGKTYTQSREVDRSGLGTIEKVIATFTRVNKFVTDIKISVVSLGTRILRTIGINIRHKK